jgi:hypothetical protein
VAFPVDGQLRDQFYRWELRGRGWLLWDYPVLPEPPFRPFPGFAIESFEEDDGRQQTLVSGALHWLHKCLRGKFRNPQPVAEEEESAPDYWEFEQSPCELRVTLPAEMEVSPQLAEQWLLSLSAAHYPVAVEFLGLPSTIVVQIVCDTVDADIVQRQVAAHFPQAHVAPTTDGALEQAWLSAGDEQLIVELGLDREFMLPLASAPRSFALDPLLGVLAALGDASQGEMAALQVIFHPARHAWEQSITRAVTFADGSPVFAQGRDYVAGAADKTTRPLYAAVIRVAARSDDRERCVSLLRGVAGALSTLADPQGNELIPLDNEGYDADQHEQDFLHRRSLRGGMLLNSAELTSLVHLPSSSIQLPKLRQRQRHTRAAQASVLNKPCVLGINEHLGAAVTVGLSADQRSRHVQVIGASGTGKSTLLLNMIAQDMESGDGVAVLDPHGDLIDAVLRLVPPERVKDVILLDPSDDEFPIAFNVLSAHSAIEKDLLASDLVAVFRRLATSWGDQMNAVLGNAILAILESDRGGTLVDLRRFLVEMPFRKEYLRSVRDPEVVYYWTKEFPLLTGRPQGPVLTRLDTFLRPKPIRYMVAQRESKLDFADILDSGKILLARLSHGAIGAENSYLLGTLLVSKLHQLALGRQHQREEQRRFFWLYIDEFHQFATPSMASILSGARKYRLGLVLAHQELQQLDGVPDVASALSNAHTRVCFRLSDQDARKLESGFAHFTASDLQNLGTGEAICRVERVELDFNLRTHQPPATPDDVAQRVREEVVRLTRERFAVPRAEVEAALARSRGPDESEDLLSTGAADDSGARKRRRSPVQSEPKPVASPDAAISSTSAETVIVPPPSVLPPTERLAGRGGTEHQELQRLIKQRTQEMGYKVTIEGQVLGTRAADVTLEKNGVSIACELCITTGFVHELGNIRKCLDAGFTYVVAITPDSERLEGLRATIEQQLEEHESARVRWLLPNQFFAFLLEIDGPEVQKTADRRRGYNVKTNYKPLRGREAAARQQQIASVMAQAMRRLNRR